MPTVAREVLLLLIALLPWAAARVPAASPPDGLLEKLRMGSAEERRAAASALGESGDAEALPDLLVSLWKDCDPATRGAAAEAAARIAGPDAAEAIRRELRRSLARADRRVTESLEGLASGLGRAGSSLDADLLGQVLARRDLGARARAAAARALGSFRDPHGAMSLDEAAREDPDAGVREAAALALRRILGPPDGFAVTASRGRSARAPRPGGE